MADVLLQVERSAQALRWRGRPPTAWTSTVAARGTARAHRSQRRRQDHAHSPAFRRAAARQRQHRVRRAARSRARSLHERVQLGLARSYQITSVFRRFSVAAQPRARGAGAQRIERALLASAGAARTALYDEARRLLLACRPRGPRAQDSPATLAHGEQRQLEVGLALATDARLLLLDEPMAGMGPDESQRMVELIARLKGVGHGAAGGARHGRGVPTGRSHLGAGVGADHRHRRAGGDPRQRGSQARLSGRRAERA